MKNHNILNFLALPACFGSGTLNEAFEFLLKTLYNVTDVVSLLDGRKTPSSHDDIFLNI